MSVRRKLAGFSLVELMVAMVLGSMLLAGVLGTFVQASLHQSERLAELELSASLEQMLAQIAGEMQRTGYLADAAVRWQAGLGLAKAYPWQSAIRQPLLDAQWHPELDLQRLLVAAPAYDCVLLRYDADGNGALGEGELFAYRYSAASHAIERKQWSSLSSQRSQGCQDGEWQDLTSDGLLQITGWELREAGAPWLWRLTIAGRMANRPSLELSSSRLVRLRNAL